MYALTAPPPLIPPAHSSGKSALAKTLVSTRPDLALTGLSIDELVAARHGIYGVDYPADADMHAAHQEEAAAAFEREFGRLLRAGNRNVVLDRSYYSLRDRESAREKVRAAGGGRVVLVYLRAAKDVLWRRIQARARAGKTANSALDIDEALLERYVESFEEPQGEGEIVVEVHQKPSPPILAGGEVQTALGD